MSGLIEKAIPTDDEAISYLRDEKKDTDLTISAFYARKLFKKGIIKNKHNFKCPTPGCDAPITCHALEEKSKSSPSPSFRNHIRTENRHISTCNKDPLSLEKAEIGLSNNGKKLENENTGEIVVKLKNGQFSTPKKPQQQQTNANKSESSGTNISSSIKGNKDRSATGKRKYNTNMWALQQLVDLYREDKETIVFSEETKRRIPVKYMFKVMYNNRMYEDISKNDLSYIYYGKVKIKETSYENTLRLEFIYFKMIDGIKYYPSFKIKRDYLENNYNDIYKAYKNGKIEFDVYTTFSFILQKSNANGQLYLNFASFEENVELECESKEFENNFLIK
ncbi:Uncharacterised protein [Staphylococcus epidermidis]|uniref:hypothetical protein n=1 Tax=Staphylococcus epidermidis TaxID=1282 RepID=UPI000E00D719|nr:hypothetical protein [Staphylococcus epidermidis]SUM53562.1 Uncharacterised protein [Staphylococcus epidermidis]